MTTLDTHPQGAEIVKARARRAAKAAKTATTPATPVLIRILADEIRKENKAPAETHIEKANREGKITPEAWDEQQQITDAEIPAFLRKKVELEKMAEIAKKAGVSLKAAKSGRTLKSPKTAGGSRAPAEKRREERKAAKATGAKTARAPASGVYAQKLSQVLDMVSKKGGARTDEILKATRWRTCHEAAIPAVRKMAEEKGLKLSVKGTEGKPDCTYSVN